MIPFLITDLTPETGVSLGLLGGAAAVGYSFWALAKKSNRVQTQAVKELSDAVSAFRETTTLELQSIKNRIDGLVSTRKLLEWLLALQKANKELIVPPLDFWDGGIAS